MITRWQAARGYPKSGYLNKLQHKALLTEIVATTPDQFRATTRNARARRAAVAAAAAAASVISGGGGGDPAGAGRFIGGVMGGMFR